MINLCSDPTCDDYADITLQRQVDVAPIPFCLPHANARQLQLDQALENYQRVSIAQLPPSDLEQAQARVAELERTHPDLGAVGTDVADHLDQALNTLELQSQTLDRARAELADRDQALQVMKGELERTRAELKRTQGELERVMGTLAAPAPADTRPDTPVPPTRPDQKKP